MATFDKTLEIIIGHLGGINDRLGSIDARIEALEEKCASTPAHESEINALDKLFDEIDGIKERLAVIEEGVHYNTDEVRKVQFVAEENSNQVLSDLNAVKTEIAEFSETIKRLTPELSEAVAVTMREIDSNKPLICKPPANPVPVKRLRRNA